jgi:hypothetical protein
MAELFQGVDNLELRDSISDWGWYEQPKAYGNG